MQRFHAGAVLCPGPSKKSKKSKGSESEQQIPTEDDYQVGAMVSSYDVHLHVAIASLRVIDATRPRTTEGRKALDLLAGKGTKRCSLCESMIHAQPATCADVLMHAGVFCQKTCRNPINFGSL